MSVWLHYKECICKRHVVGQTVRKALFDLTG